MPDVDYKAAKAAFETFQKLTGIEGTSSWHSGPVLTWDQIDITTRAMWIQIARAAREVE